MLKMNDIDLFSFHFERTEEIRISTDFHPKKKKKKTCFTFTHRFSLMLPNALIICRFTKILFSNITFPHRNINSLSYALSK